jgi:MSHA pilin protein MshD
LARGLARGFTLVEVCVSVLIVGVMLAAALQTVGQSGLMQYRLSERARAGQLARMLMAEVLQQAYAETSATPAFGAESGETRATYEDVDDYDGLVETPPTNKDGSSLHLPAAGTWKRTVSVQSADPETLDTASLHADQGAKLVTVSVYHNNVLVTKLCAVRTSAP